ncbi:MAG: undecaprenyl/decaprenyl-phosphate alpha-N-acetylglucosaminyl 1-phosphate transferase [Ahniella sp.]|nr:undecaprenyl/decaprenyl-phosphate alpha-N-acetylglucosaminyl 1-phosphate transferase [Ahniella sp.]
MGSALTTGLFTFAGTHVLIGVLAWLAPRAGWVDRPGGHKHHLGDVPVIGGLAVMLAVSLSVWLAGPPGARSTVVLAGMAALCLLGLVDDRWSMSARTRIIIQANVVALVLVLADVQLISLGSWVPGIDDLQLGWAMMPFSVFCVVGVINAFNMVDGMDGLSSSLFLLVAAALWLLMSTAGSDAGLLFLLSTMIAAMLAFLCWNWPLRWRLQRIFLGDAGTLPIGLLLGVLLVDTSQQPNALAPAAALWLFAWPLIDTVSVILRRLTQGKSAFSADQRHIHHLVVAGRIQCPPDMDCWPMLAQGLMAGSGFADDTPGWPMCGSPAAFWSSRSGVI